MPYDRHSESAKAAKREYDKKYREDNKDRQKKRHSDYYQATKEHTKDKRRDNNYRRNFGISLADYDHMLAEQGGRCKVCGTIEPGGQGRFHVDHNHVTKEVRGLLCHNCNVGLGHFKDSPDLLQAARNYLLTEGYFGFD